MQRWVNSIGLSLIELLIAMVILGIITTLALPSYSHYLLKTRRADAQTSLLDLATRLERYYTQNNYSYSGADFTTNLGLNSDKSAQGFYTLAITAMTANTYALQATPIVGSSQVNDSTCGSFTLDQTGLKGITGNGKITECWNN